MTDAQRQAAINAQPKILNPGVTLTFLFEDGIHNIGQNIDISGFSGGTIKLVSSGAGATTTAHRNQPAELRGSDLVRILNIGAISSHVDIRNLRLLPADNGYSIRLHSGCTVWFLYSSMSGGYGIWASDNAHIRMLETVADNQKHCLQLQHNATGATQNCIGTNNTVSIYLYQGGWHSRVGSVFDGALNISGGITTGY